MSKIKTFAGHDHNSYALRFQLFRKPALKNSFSLSIVGVNID
ncbi:hypothetical protein PAMC26577_21710 [Caballeronia sordidicola]|uniref:Uncharacterized protein n=1 Tax=Caballeronia sordidicola TaxID=196367 RepID=A0A242MLX9_CABSO|nr:hypothetical protein PAMC26577_21710 [Caballeronia sordidicola]